MKTLRSQKLRDKDFAAVESEINELLWKIVFEPVIALVKKFLPKAEARELPELQNVSDSAFRRALQSGKIQMVIQKGIASFVISGGQSKRDWTDTMKAFGATFNHTTKMFTVDASKVPGWINTESEKYTVKMKLVHDQLKKLLKELRPKVKKVVDDYKFKKGIDKAVKSVDEGWKESAKGLETMTDLGAEGLKTLGEEFEKTAKIPIKDWAQESIDRLREQVDENALQGFRAEGLAKRIHSEYGVSVSRANLIARQETSNFMANFRQARAADAGISKYRWRSMMDSRARKSHKDHNGRIFEYKKPPIVDPVSGRRGNPGQDFRCLPESAKLNFALGVEKFYRRKFTGKLTTVVTKMGPSISATSNHPVLTTLGWKSIGMLNQGDQIIGISQERIHGLKDDFDQSVSSFGKIFDSLLPDHFELCAPTTVDQFHGDGLANHEVDVVGTTRVLRRHWKTRLPKDLQKCFFSESDFLAPCFGDTNQIFSSRRGRHISASRGKERSTKVMPLSFSHFIKAKRVGLGNIAQGNTALLESLSEDHTSHDSSFFQRNKTFTTLIPGYDSIKESLRVYSVIKVSTNRFIGHVYNLQATNGWYVADSIIQHNCRCVDEPVLEAA